MEENYCALKNKGLSDRVIFETLFPKQSRHDRDEPFMIRMKLSDLTRGQLIIALTEEIKKVKVKLFDLSEHDLRQILRAIIKSDI